jgi:hypothetical protein
VPCGLFAFDAPTPRLALFRRFARPLMSEEADSSMATKAPSTRAA